MGGHVTRGPQNEASTNGHGRLLQPLRCYSPQLPCITVALGMWLLGCR